MVKEYLPAFRKGEARFRQTLLSDFSEQIARCPAEQDRNQNRQ